MGKKKKCNNNNNVITKSARHTSSVSESTATHRFSSSPTASIVITIFHYLLSGNFRRTINVHAAQSCEIMNAIYFGKTYVGGGGGDRAPDTAVGFVPLLWSNNIRARPIRLGFSERTVFDFCFRFKTRDKNVVGIVGMSRRVLHRYRRGR